MLSDIGIKFINQSCNAILRQGFPLQQKVAQIIIPKPDKVAKLAELFRSIGPIEII